MGSDIIRNEQHYISRIETQKSMTKVLIPFLQTKHWEKIVCPQRTLKFLQVFVSKEERRKNCIILYKESLQIHTFVLHTPT
jgi:hypothetical protein